MTKGKETRCAHLRVQTRRPSSCLSLEKYEVDSCAGYRIGGLAKKRSVRP